MKKLVLKKSNKKNTITIFWLIVFFCVFLLAIILFNIYSNNVSPKVTVLIEEKLDKVLYQFFDDLITNDVINNESVNNLLEINKNNQGEILTVNYDLEKTYKILTEVTTILKDGINDLENGKIDVKIYDEYLDNKDKGLIMNIPLFLGSSNVFISNLGPKIPIKINFNETLLTNIKTKVTNYGFNNALLEIYITVEIQRLIITPMKSQDDNFNYDILVGALVVNGSVPDFYGGEYQTSSAILDIPINL